MRDIKRDWLDSHPMPWLMVLKNWLSVSRVAVGTPTLVLAIAGAVLWRRTNLAYKLCLLSFLGLHYALFPYYFCLRYVATVAPIICILAASVCASCLQSGRRSIRTLGGYAITVGLAYSCICCVSGLYYRLHDPRDAACRYLQTHILDSCTFACADTDYGSGEWLYPSLEAGPYKKVDLLASPDLILVDTSHLACVRGLFDHGLICDDYSLTREGLSQWTPNRPHPPEYFRLYRKLMSGDGEYELVHACEAPCAIAPEYSSGGLLIFARKDRLQTLGLRGDAPGPVTVRTDRGGPRGL
jgi:hypothetical protein